MISVFICGGSGYTGSELLRILSGHPEVAVTGVTSEKSAGKSVTALFPHLRNYSDLLYEPLHIRDIPRKADLFFLALPHGASQEAVDFIFSQGKKVVDLSADYRLRNPGTYSEWYKVPHKYQNTLKKAVYGLPEVYRSRIRKARLIANPGCYPTGAMLGLIPAMKQNLIDTASIVIDSKSGASGAGRKADVELSYCEVNGGFRAYSVGTHRHTPEIEQELAFLCGKPVAVNFTPHLLPAARGILTTIYARLAKKVSVDKLEKIYRFAYKMEPFIRVLDYGHYPDIRHVSGTNFCDIGLKLNERTNTLVIITAIDNLVKGASGQAVQNMNIMLGFEETTALDSLTVFP